MEMTTGGIDLDPTIAVNSLYMLGCTTAVAFVVLGVAIFYSGFTQRRSSLTMLVLPLVLFPFVFIDWFIWGYSLCYASAVNRYIGSLNFVVLRHLRDSATTIYVTSRGSILSVNHFLFNGMMKVVCAALTFPGCIAERGRVLPMLVFCFFWSVIIYNPVTYWFWNRLGWLSVEYNKQPVLDFAGGNCIHIVSGFTTLAYSYILGPRNPKILINYRNSSTSYVAIGIFFIVAGWCGFIAGCDFRFSTLSVYIIVNTLLSAFTSGIVWMAIDFYFSAIPYEGNFKSTRKMSVISLSSGLMTGLVAITPGGGYVSNPNDFWKPFVYGVVGAIICNLATRLKFYAQIDDALDLFAIHGVAGIVGSLLTGIFSNTEYSSDGGWVQGHWIQFAYQLLGCTVTSAYVFVMSIVILYLIDYTPGLHLRIDKTFNQRTRWARNACQEEAMLDLTTSDIEGQNINVPSEEDLHYESLELLGMDAYVLNGEYAMDFMEFIKELRPQDYEDNETINDYDNTQPVDSTDISPFGGMDASTKKSE